MTQFNALAYLLIGAGNELKNAYFGKQSERVTLHNTQKSGCVLWYKETKISRRAASASWVGGSTKYLPSELFSVICPTTGYADCFVRKETGQ